MEFSTNPDVKDIYLRNSNFTQFELNLIISISTSTCVVGTLSNVLSLSYFLSVRSKKLGDNLLVLLNILDLSASLSGSFYLVLWKFLEVDIVLEVFILTLYLVFVELFCCKFPR